MDLTPLFNLMAEKEASDMFITADSPVYFKIKGSIHSVAERIVKAEEIEEMISHLITGDAYKTFKEKNDFDSSLFVEGVGRFRLNFFVQKGSPGMVARRISTELPTLESLKLPSQLADVAMLNLGLVLIVGGTGSGKSTTLAAMINHRNSNKEGHIITIEDPIEFIHEHKKSIITQREIGTDSESYRSALRGALRQAPDVLLIGEIRDRESMEAAISFAETGHLVMGTLHANNAPQTLDRIMGFFPHDMHDMLRLQLSQNLQAVLAQRLITAKRRKERFVVVEFMTLTSRISDLILKGEFQTLKSAIERSAGQGMISFDESLYQLYKSGRIDVETALVNSDFPTDLQLRIRSEEETEITTNIKLLEEESESDKTEEDSFDIE
ncbi:MAG: PilT/PilU family type 4a pilus ATPase [Candidatus Marinimicrobia bacterium]|nr:PilT/PilU family type 4a pilus ATPase [Candidatus Neomarinimicrobiota bacterium]